MNDTQEKQVNLESEDEMWRRRGAYRRGARDKTKGNFALFVVVAVLAVVVIVGVVFAIKTFMPSGEGSAKVPQDSSPVSNTQQNVVASTSGFESVIGGYAMLTNDTAVAEIADGEVVFNDGILSYCRKDLDSDGEDELFLVSVTGGDTIEMSVYENSGGACIREGYYVFTRDIFDVKDSAKTEIYISEVSDKAYICTEKYSFDDGLWELEVLGYDEGFEVVDEYLITDGGDYDDELADDIKELGLEYSGADYGEGSELKMNGDTDTALLLCSFETDDEKLDLNID